jgi:4-oxalocrotonate tautomerase
MREQAMPIIRLDGPPIEDLDTKRRMAKEMTEAASRAYGMSEAHIVILINENQPQNVAVGGELIVDRRKGG